MSSITINAPAKINLVLRVVGRREDGYHDVVMVMEKLRVYDEIALETIDLGIELSTDGQRDAGMVAEKNLAWRAASIFKEALNEPRGVRISLKKRIPVAAGLGGGSSDAATVLIGLNRLWNKNLGSEELAMLGAKLGADVPFFCYEGPALVEGIGDRVKPIDKLPKLYVLLINPGFAVPTPWVYGEWDRRFVEIQNPNSKIQEKQFQVPSSKFQEKRGFAVTNHELRVTNSEPKPGSGPLLKPKPGPDPFGFQGLTLKTADARVPRLFEAFHDVTAHLANDLEAVTVSKYPQVSEIKKYLMDAGAKGALMSGSGPTVFGLFSTASARDRAAEMVTNMEWKVFATEN